MKNKISLNEAITLCNIGAMITLCVWMYSISVQYKTTTESLVRIETTQVESSPESKAAQLKHDKTMAMLNGIEADLKSITESLKLQNSK